MLRRTMRGVKATLAVVALAAVVLVWPPSHYREGEVAARRWTVEADRVTDREVCAAYADGRVGLRTHRGDFTAGGLADGRLLAAAAAPAGPSGWTWRYGAQVYAWRPGDHERAWGPFGWSVTAHDEPGLAATWRSFSVPCWLLACAAGAWPAASLAAWAIRRRRLRRRAAAGRCLHCGYDLRATPSAGDGGLFGRCPECGTAAADPIAATSDTLTPPA